MWLALSTTHIKNCRSSYTIFLVPWNSNVFYWCPLQRALFQRKHSFRAKKCVVLFIECPLYNCPPYGDLRERNCAGPHPFPVEVSALWRFSLFGVSTLERYRCILNPVWIYMNSFVNNSKNRNSTHILTKAYDFYKSKLFYERYNEIQWDDF